LDYRIKNVGWKQQNVNKIGIKILFEVDTLHSLEEMQEKCQTTESLLGHLDITMQTGMSVDILDIRGVRAK